MVVEGPDWMALSVAPSAAAALPAPPWPPGLAALTARVRRAWRGFLAAWAGKFGKKLPPGDLIFHMQMIINQCIYIIYFYGSFSMAMFHNQRLLAEL